MESGYSASEKHLEDEVVAVEMREQQQQQPPLLDPSELPSERLSLPSSQTDGKLANRDSGIDSISSPSHSEELCFAGVDDGGVVYPCSPALLPRLSSSSSYAGEGGEGEEGDVRGGPRRRREFSEEGDSDLEEEEAELTLVLPSSKADRQDSTEVRQEVRRVGGQGGEAHVGCGSSDVFHERVQVLVFHVVRGHMSLSLSSCLSSRGSSTSPTSSCTQRPPTCLSFTSWTR